ncbi:Abortive infection protein [Richelia intracellularis HH01]|uniref:Abortive infection protein n=1 Tax=Richelia intracellularis HH01 TaxID=1165094 RepID=M1X2V3_9NOST|nr:Abortive infection protein [Richelia intracellularis HH01]
MITLGAVFFYSQTLFDSWEKPQIHGNLELYQTNIILQAQEWNPENNAFKNLKTLKVAFVSKQPLETAIKQYEKVRKSAAGNLEKIQLQLTKQTDISVSNLELGKNRQKQLQVSLQQQRKVIDRIDLHLGIMQAAQANIDRAIQIWADLKESSEIDPDIGETALALSGLWSDSPKILPGSQKLIENNLTGWFRFASLSKLYKLQQTEENLSDLLFSNQKNAEEAVFKLGIVSIPPLITGILGVALLIVIIIQRVIRGRNSLWAQNEDLYWLTPWDGEITLQVFIFGFFLTGQVFIGQFIMPLILSILPLTHPINIQTQALLVISSYFLVAFGVLTVLYFSIKNFLPLHEGWFHLHFQGKWFLWGSCGYCVAGPIVVFVSALNQKLFQGQGGSNPLLQLALDSQDTVALFIFFITAGVAAPLFEEYLFRGFLLPSLTRYFSMWGAITVSSLLFAIVHLNLSEIIPLTALGMVLGFVYTRSRNLMAPIVLHSIWNSSTLVSLFVLGSSGK